MKQRGKLSVLLLDDSIISRLFNLKDSIPVHFNPIHLVLGRTVNVTYSQQLGNVLKIKEKWLSPFCAILWAPMKSPLCIFFSAITLTLKASSLLQSLGGLRVAEEDFLGNQTRMNFPGNQTGGGFSWESNGGCKIIIIIIIIT